MTAKSRSKKIIFACLACILATVFLAMAGCSAPQEAAQLPDPEPQTWEQTMEEAGQAADYGWKLPQTVDTFYSVEDAVKDAEAIVYGRIVGEPSAWEETEDGSYLPCDLSSAQADCFQYSVEVLADGLGHFSPGEKISVSVRTSHLMETSHPAAGTEIIVPLLSWEEDGKLGMLMGDVPTCFLVTDSGHILSIGNQGYLFSGLGANALWEEMLRCHEDPSQEMVGNPLL